MRILLVQAYTALDMELVYPIGLAYLAAYLVEHDVRIFDINLHPADGEQRLAAELEAFAPDVVGLSLRNIKVARPGSMEDDFAPQERTVQLIRKTLPKAYLVIGGTAFSLFAETFMKRLPQVDAGVWGEGEERFAELVRTRNPGVVPGVYWRDEAGRVAFTGPPAPVDFARLAPPRRDLVPMAPYAASSFVSVGVQSKRGCVLECTHCSDVYLVGHSVRQRDPREVVDEIEHLVHDHAVRELFFCDQIFNIPPSHAIAICRELAARRVPVRWSAWFNENRNTLPDELMVWLKRAGCGLLSFSPDHVDDRMLQALKKNFRADDLAYAVETARRFGMEVEFSFFLNSPGESATSMMRLFGFLAWARWRLGPRLRAFTLLMMQPIRIYPHTELARMAVAEGVIESEEELVEARFYNPGHLSLGVAGVQAGSAMAWGLRQEWRRRTGTAARRLA